MHSNFILSGVKKLSHQNYVGKLSWYVIGHVLEYLDYKTVMATIRYLNKSFLFFTERLLHYVPGLDLHAYLKCNLSDMYNGKCKIPPLCHAYYQKCTKLNIIYFRTTLKDINNKSKIETMFFIDLFQRKELFPKLKELSIYVSHSYT